MLPRRHVNRRSVWLDMVALRRSEAADQQHERDDHYEHEPQEMQEMDLIGRAEQPPA